MARRLIISGMILLMLHNLNSINSKKQQNIERARNGEHVVIAPEEFLIYAEQYADFYWNEFQIDRVIIDQQDIFDQYSTGIADPEAIRLYLIDFFDDPSIWMDSSVLLMGSGTLEWSVPDQKNKIVVSQWSDDEFVDLDGDGYPNVPIGRFPAQNVGQLEHIVNNNIQYITNPNFGWWQNKMLIVADDEHKGGGLEGCAYGHGMNHTARAQDTAELLSDAVWIDRVFGIEYEMDNNGNKPDATHDIIEKINEGRLIWHYIGHGYEDILGDEEYFRASSHLQWIQNIDLLPLFTAASCYVGNYITLEIDCMAEKFLTYESGGAIAAIAARSACSGTFNNELFYHFYQNIINEYQNLGAALLDAKLNSEAHYMNSRQYNILGDPLLFVNPPERDENLSILENPSMLFLGDNVSISGQLPSNDYFECEFKAFESEYSCTYENEPYYVEYTRFGNPYFEENILIYGNQYETGFVLPSEIQTGAEARMISYCYGEEGDFVQYLYPITISDGTHSPDIPLLPIELSASNYPNPFNPSTTISYSLPIDSTVNISIYNMKGQLVKQLLNESRSAGTHSAFWDGENMNGSNTSGGVYLYRVQTSEKTISKKMVLLK
jgi:Peptidase family C25/Secretion system C-terminal sorting domain